MINHVVLVGRLGNDPEVRETSGGTSVANVSLATDETFKNRAGEKQKRTEWHRLVLWDKLAGIAKDYLHKGDLIGVTGKIQSREYEDSSGIRKTVVEIVVASLKMLSTGKTEGTTASAKATAKPRRQEVEIGEDDIPF